jgi:hypothetical protein
MLQVGDLARHAVTGEIVEITRVGGKSMVGWVSLADPKAIERSSRAWWLRYLASPTERGATG